MPEVKVSKAKIKTLQERARLLTLWFASFFGFRPSAFLPA
jgi:hypothetical protein